jgi:hypothetical protein
MHAPVKRRLRVPRPQLLAEGTSVSVRVERSQEVAPVTDEELELVRRGQAEAARGECVDLRQALQKQSV